MGQASCYQNGSKHRRADLFSCECLFVRIRNHPQKMKTKPRPNYGLDAPAIIKRFGIFSIAGIILSIVLLFALPSGWVRNISVTLSSMITLSVLYPTLAIPFGSTFLKFRHRDWLLEQIPWHS